MPSTRPGFPFVFAPLVSALSFLFVLGPNDAHSRDCGDDIGGVRIACACGDTVVRNTTLQVGDPVVRQRCMNGGLTIVADPFAETLTLNLNGLSLIGSGVDDGIRVQAGGSDGAVIVGSSNGRRAQVVGFGVGISVHSGRQLRRIEAVEVSGSRHDGLRLVLAGTMVLDVKASRNGGDGIRASGQGGRILDSEASENAGAGIRLESSYTVLQARAERNHDNGVVVRGARNDVSGTIARGNDGFGVVLGGMNTGSDRVETEGNSKGGIGHPSGRQPS